MEFNDTIIILQIEKLIFYLISRERLTPTCAFSYVDLVTHKQLEKKLRSFFHLSISIVIAVVDCGQLVARFAGLL